MFNCICIVNLNLNKKMVSSFRNRTWFLPTDNWFILLETFYETTNFLLFEFEKNKFFLQTENGANKIDEGLYSRQL